MGAKVYVVGRPSLDLMALVDYVGKGYAETITGTDAEVLAEVAGRTCYQSFYGKRRESNQYLAHIIESGHGSVLEHVVWNFVFTGISRSLSHELVRHRAGWAYSQLSQRYVECSDVEFICPDIIAKNECLYRKWEIVTEIIGDVYCEMERSLAEQIRIKNKDGKLDKLTRLKMSRQAARSVLPNATETKIFASANARALRHFIEMRGSRDADVEIRHLALQVLEIMKHESPRIFGDYRLVPIEGTSEFEAVTDYRKV